MQDLLYFIRPVSYLATLGLRDLPFQDLGLVGTQADDNLLPTEGGKFAVDLDSRSPSGQISNDVSLE